MKWTERHKLILYSFCKVVKGRNRSIICNLQKENIKFIPNTMVDVIQLLKHNSFQEVKRLFLADVEIFNSYVSFLVDNGFAFFTSEDKPFIEINNYWSSPETINNVILEYNFDTYNLNDVLLQLDELLAKYIELRLANFNEEHIGELENIIHFCSHSVIRSIKICLPFQSEKLRNKIVNIVKQTPVVECIVFYDSPIASKNQIDQLHVDHIAQNLDDINNANIDSKYLVNNLTYFLECQNYNPYYNKKLSVNRLGQIKNCIKNVAVFGNVLIDKIGDVVKRTDFQEFWYVTHDNIIDICDSELRYHYIITNDLKKLNNGKYKIIE